MAVGEAEIAALAAGQQHFRTKMRCHDGHRCGTAWVEVSSPTPDQRAATGATFFAGFKPANASPLIRVFEHGAETEQLCCKEAANKAAAAVLRYAGLKARMKSLADRSGGASAAPLPEEGAPCPP